MIWENCWPQDRTDLFYLSVVSSVFPSFLGNGWRVASLFGSSWVAAFP